MYDPLFSKISTKYIYNSINIVNKILDRKIYLYLLMKDFCIIHLEKSHYHHNTVGNKN